MTGTHRDGRSARERMLAGLALTERRLPAAGVATAVLEGGDGPPVMLLHGPGECAGSWLPVLEALVRRYQVVVPDLPGHGASEVTGGALDVPRVLDWLEQLVEATCPVPPVLVGRVVGGAIGARFAAERPGRLAQLVLVDTLGLAPFEPDPRFGLALHRFLGDPTAASYERLMDLCAFDLDRVRQVLGERWAAYAEYAVALSRRPEVQAAMGVLIGQFGNPIPSEELARIDVPTTLIWGRHDLATPLHVAQATAARQGWPLQVIENAGDDPPLDQPDAFLDFLYRVLGETSIRAGVS